VQGLAPSQQFGVDLREFLQLFLELTVVFDALASGLLLVGCFGVRLKVGERKGEISDE